MAVVTLVWGFCRGLGELGGPLPQYIKSMAIGIVGELFGESHQNILHLEYPLGREPHLEGGGVVSVGKRIDFGFKRSEITTS